MLKKLNIQGKRVVLSREQGGQKPEAERAHGLENDSEGGWQQITNGNLPCITGNSTQYSVMAYMGKDSKKKTGYTSMYNGFTLLNT